MGSLVCLGKFYLFVHLKVQSFLSCDGLCMFKVLLSCSGKKMSVLLFQQFSSITKVQLGTDNWLVYISVFYLHVPDIAVVMVNFMFT